MERRPEWLEAGGAESSLEREVEHRLGRPF